LNFNTNIFVPAKYFHNFCRCVVLELSIEHQTFKSQKVLESQEKSDRQFYEVVRNILSLITIHWIKTLDTSISYLFLFLKCL